MYEIFRGVHADRLISSSLEKLKAGVDPTMKGKIDSFCAQSLKFFSNTTRGFDNLGTLPTDIAGLQTAIAERTLRDTQTSTQIIGQLDTISSSSRLLISKGDSTVTKLGILENRVSRSISTLTSIAMDIEEILRRLQTFSRDFSKMILANGCVALSLQVIFKGILWPLRIPDLCSIVPYLAILIFISTNICVKGEN